MAMKPQTDLEIFTLRHFFFYLGIACVATVLVWAASIAMRWSNGLTFGVVVLAALLVSLTAIRKSLFAPPRRPLNPRR